MRELAGDLEALAAPAARPIEDAATDLRLALRSLRKHPGFTAVVLATLALGIGANAAIFTVVNAILLRPLPYRDADRLMVVRGDLHRPGVNEIPTSAGEFVDYRDRSHAFEQLAAYDTIDINLTGSGEPELLSGAVTTASLFQALGATPEIGRTLQPADERPEQDRGVVIGHRLWVRSLRCRPERRRPPCPAGRPACAHRRRDAGGLPVSRRHRGDLETDCVRRRRGERQQPRIARLHHDRAAEAWRVAGTGARGPRGDHRHVQSRASQQLPDRVQRVTAAAAAGDCRRRRPPAADSACVGGAGAADRLRQRGQPAARPRRVAAQGDRVADRTRRKPGAPGAPAADRKRASSRCSAAR